MTQQLHSLHLAHICLLAIHQNSKLIFLRFLVSHDLYPENRGRGRARKSSTCPGPLPTPHATQALSKALPQQPPLAPVSPTAVLPAPISISVPVTAGLRGIPGGSLTQSPKLVTIYIEKHQIMLKIGLDTNFPLFKKISICGHCHHHYHQHHDLSLYCRVIQAWSLKICVLRKSTY